MARRIPPNFKRGFDWLDQHKPFFSIIVENLGTPIDDPQVPTACVRLPNNEFDKGFEFAVNEDFLSGLTDEEVAGVLSHEGFHVVFDHLDDFRDDYLKNEKKRTLAQECICNDNIVNEGIKLPDIGLFYGPAVVGRGVSSYTTREVYDLISDEEAEEQMGNQEVGHLGDLSPEDAQKLKDAIKGAVQDAVDQGKIDAGDLSDEEADAMDVDRGPSQKAGTEGSKELHELKEKNITMEWAKYIQGIDPTSFRQGGMMGDLKASWHLPRKKLAYMQDEIRLPSYRPKHDDKKKRGGFKPHIVLALDFSGSIPQHMLTVMSNLAHTVPKSIEVSCCTFSTFSLPYDPDLFEKQSVATGGTAFDAIQEFIDTLNLKNDPSVVVITDGYANFYRRRPDQKILDEKWNWLLIDRSNVVQERGVNPDTVKYLDDFVTGI